MSKFKRFSDFLKAKEGLAGFDYDGPLATKPKEEKKEKQEPASVYMAYDDDDDKGLAHKATPGVTPETSSLGSEPKFKKVSNKPKKLTSEEFVNLTKDMDTHEMVKFMLEHKANSTLSTVTDLQGNEFTPDPIQSIHYVAGLILASPAWMQRFVMEMKERKGIQNLFEELLDHNESYNSIVVSLEDEDSGKTRSNKLARHMNDSYLNVLKNFDLGDEEEEEDIFFPNFSESTSPSLKDIFGGSSSDSNVEQQPQSDKDPNYQGGDPNYQGDVMGDDSMGAQKAFPQVGKTQQQPMPQKKMKEGSSKPKYKGKCAASNIIEEMASYPHFLEMMKR